MNKQIIEKLLEKMTEDLKTRIDLKVILTGIEEGSPENEEQLEVNLNSFKMMDSVSALLCYGSIHFLLKRDKQE